MTRTRYSLTFASLLFVAGIAIADDEPKNVKDSAPPELLGGYTVVSGEKFGETIPADRIEGTTVRIAEDGIVVLDKEKKEVYAQTYTIDTSKKPWAITMKTKIAPYIKDATAKDEDDSAKEKDRKEPVAQGLIEKDGDTVRLIYALPGGETPTEFKTKAKQLMFEMKNMKK
jgi:uncharacterized protein (TIGR03067 family)